MASERARPLTLRALAYGCALLRRVSCKHLTYLSSAASLPRRAGRIAPALSSSRLVLDELDELEATR